MNNSILSQNKKAREARRWRATNTARKRFDVPLREFIKIKYKDIYNEYSQFYRRLDKKYPSVRDLSTTGMFKKWVRGDQQLESQQTPDEREIPDEPVHQESQPHIYQREIPDKAVQQESQHDILTLAINETLHEHSVIQELLPEGIPEQVSSSLRPVLPEINPHENIEEIVNELEQDEAVRNILNPIVDEMIDRYNVQISTDADEGIELNFIDEIDLQPFDYELEVDF